MLSVISYWVLVIRAFLYCGIANEASKLPSETERIRLLRLMMALLREVSEGVRASDQVTLDSIKDNGT